MSGINTSPLTRRLLSVYIGVILVIMYVPMVVVGLASISKSRFFIFPIRRTSSKWYEQTFDSLQVQESFLTSLTVAASVALISVILAFFGALAYARFDWRGRGVFQQVILIPIFFPQAVLGLALQLWFNSMGIQMAWQATVFAQLVWIVPIVTLIIAFVVVAIIMVFVIPVFEDMFSGMGAALPAPTQIVITDQDGNQDVEVRDAAVYPVAGFSAFNDDFLESYPS